MWKCGTRSRSLSGKASDLDYFLDTSVAIGLRDRDPAVVTFIRRLAGPGLLSVISQVELEGGVDRDPSQAALRRTRLERLLALLTVVQFGSIEARAYGEIVRAVGYSRRKLIDRMIAAQALVRNATLVTTNPADFRDVPGLQLLAL